MGVNRSWFGSGSGVSLGLVRDLVEEWLWIYRKMGWELSRNHQGTIKELLRDWQVTIKTGKGL